MSDDNLNLVSDYLNVIRGNQTLLQNISFYTYKNNTDLTEVIQTFLYNSNRINNQNLINENRINENVTNEPRRTNNISDSLEDIIFDLLNESLTETQRTIRRPANTRNPAYTRNINSFQNRRADQRIFPIFSGVIPPTSTIGQSRAANARTSTNPSTRTSTGVSTNPYTQTPNETPIRTSTGVSTDANTHLSQNLNHEIRRNIDTGRTENNTVINDSSSGEQTHTGTSRTVSRRLFANTESESSPWQSSINYRHRSSESDENNVSSNVIIDRDTPNTRRTRPRRRRLPFSLTNTSYYSVRPTATTTTNFDSPHRIRPSVAQIYHATEVINYSDNSGNHQTHCPIDLNPFTENDSILRIRHCQHIFRELNLRNHFRYSPRCPICRYDIRDYRDTVRNENTTSVQEGNANTETNDENASSVQQNNESVSSVQEGNTNTEQNNENTNTEQNNENRGTENREIIQTNYNVWPPI